jgi:hypothetical protein
MLGHALAIEHFADERLLESLGRLFAFRQFVEAIGHSGSTARTSWSGRILGPQAAGFDDPVEFRLA